MKLHKIILFRIVLLLAIAAILIAQFHQHRDDLTVLYFREVKDPGRIREYFNAHSVRKLQLGAGAHYSPGWLNTDIEPSAHIVYLDATSNYPFEDGSFQYVFAEHLIEHLPWEGGLKMLRECHRVLSPGGKIRIVTPNLAKLVHLLNDGAAPESQKIIDAHRRLFGWPETPIGSAYVFNKVVREWGHQFIYDPPTLRKTIELAGFKDIRELRIGDKTDPVFEEVESRTTRSAGDDIRLTNSWGAMAFEAVR